MDYLSTDKVEDIGYKSKIGAQESRNSEWNIGICSVSDTEVVVELRIELKVSKFVHTRFVHVLETIRFLGL